MSESKGVKRDHNGKFAAGTAKPRNAGRGRKKTPPDIKAAFEELSHTAVEVLKQILNDDEAKPSDRLKAAETVLDRALGKPQQAVKADVNNTSPPQALIYEDSLELSGLSDEELDQLDKLLNKAYSGDNQTTALLPDNTRFF
jgi:hypothetical protein